MQKRHSHCSFCGARFPDDAAWPRTCAACSQITYRNPLPVAVAVLPVDRGLLTVRRGIPPAIGKLALPGGYIEYGESWQAAVARELFEETAITIDPNSVAQFGVHSAPDGTLLVFGLAPKTTLSALPAFTPSTEATERVILEAPEELAFSLHTAVVREYFAKRG